jgi:hypothetical protein
MEFFLPFSRRSWVNTVAAGDLLAMLARIPDPRGRQGRRFGLSAMLATVVCGILTGARGYTAIAEWIHHQEVQIWHWLGYTRRPPCPNAFRKLLMSLDPDALEAVLREWAEHLLGETLPPEWQAVSIDGKTLCSTLAGHGRSVHLLSVLDQRTGFVLSQQEVDSKTNEHKGALQLLKTMVLKGRLVTGDAMFCQRDLCQQIVDAGGHYLFVVKDNQPSLKEAIAADFRPGFSPLYGTRAAAASLGG